MKKSVTVLIVLMFLLTGCTQYRAVKSEELTDFKQDILSEHKEISKLKIVMAPTVIEFRYYLDREPEREADEDIFLMTKELVLSESFQKSAVEESYFKFYSKDDRDYPDITISFFGSDKNKTVYQYESSYLGPGPEGLGWKERRDRAPIDGYHTWYFDDHTSLPIPVEP